MVGQGGQLTATLRAADGTILTGRTIAWTTSNAAIASVSSSGWVSATGVGTAQVTATSEGKSATASIVVSAAQAAVAAVVVTPSEAYGYVGDSGLFLASVRDAAGNELTGRTVTWSTSDAAVATVTAGGVVAASTARPASGIRMVSTAARIPRSRRSIRTDRVHPCWSRTALRSPISRSTRPSHHA